MVYDITRKETFDNIVSWLQEVKDNGSKNVLMVLIGNKLDLEEE